MVIPKAELESNLKICLLWYHLSVISEDNLSDNEGMDK